MKEGTDGRDGKRVEVKETDKGKIELKLSVALTPDEAEALKIICQIKKKPMHDVLEKAIKDFISSGRLLLL